MLKGEPLNDVDAVLLRTALNKDSNVNPLEVIEQCRRRGSALVSSSGRPLEAEPQVTNILSTFVVALHKLQSKTSPPSASASPSSSPAPSPAPSPSPPSSSPPPPPNGPGPKVTVRVVLLWTTWAAAHMAQQRQRKTQEPLQNQLEFIRSALIAIVIADGGEEEQGVIAALAVLIGKVLRYLLAEVRNVRFHELCFQIDDFLVSPPARPLFPSYRPLNTPRVPFDSLVNTREALLNELQTSVATAARVNVPMAPQRRLSISQQVLMQNNALGPMRTGTFNLQWRKFVNQPGPNGLESALLYGKLEAFLLACVSAISRAHKALDSKVSQDGLRTINEVADWFYSLYDASMGDKEICEAIRLVSAVHLFARHWIETSIAAVFCFDPETLLKVQGTTEGNIAQIAAFLEGLAHRLRESAPTPELIESCDISVRTEINQWSAALFAAIADRGDHFVFN